MIMSRELKECGDELIASTAKAFVTAAEHYRDDPKGMEGYVTLMLRIAFESYAKELRREKGGFPPCSNE